VEDAQRWAELFRQGKSIVEVARRDEVDPKIVSEWLHRLGVEIRQGQHRVEQLPLKYSKEFIDLVKQGPEHVLELVNNRVWGITATGNGLQRLRSFCEFVQLHQQGVGVKEIARRLSVHRSTVAERREGTDQPYLVKTANLVTSISPLGAGVKVLPLHLESGGNNQSGWIRVPEKILAYSDILTVMAGTEPLEETYQRAQGFGLSKLQIDNMRPELFAYLLGILLGDAGKLGGQQERFASMDVDLQLTKKQSSNEALGELSCMCVNNLGIAMNRIGDKEPSGASRTGLHPEQAYRWTSARSPLLAWMFSVCLGLEWGKTTSYDEVHMQWILDTPFDFRKRFVQALSDSDASVKEYAVVLTSVPNADFITKLLHSLGLASARTVYEYGEPLRTSVLRKEAAALPMFNELTKGYRYRKLIEE
jgi:transposase-like protein